jgi:hypothetical protein
MIRITSKVDGYRRCGVLHPARPTEYPDDRFSAEELAVLQADPLLTVEVEPDRVDARTVGYLDPVGLQEMTVAQLKKLAADMELEVPEKATKKQLIALICKEPVMVDDEAAAGAAE